jgi:hypothetical protein
VNKIALTLTLLLIIVLAMFLSACIGGGGGDTNGSGSNDQLLTTNNQLKVHSPDATATFGAEQLHIQLTEIARGSQK